MYERKIKTLYPFFRYSQSIVVFVISILIYILCYDKPYKVIALHPLAYMIINIFYNNYSRKKNKYTGGFIYRIALIVIFIRYVITPLSIALTGEFYYKNIYTSRESIILAVYLMIFELICVYLTLYIARYYYSKKHNNTITNEVNMLNSKFILILFAFIGAVVVLLVEPNLIIPTDFLLLSNDYQKVQLNIAYDGLYSTLADLIKPVIFLIIFSRLKEKYDLYNKKIYILFSFMLVILLMSMYTGTARFEILFSGIIGLYLLLKTYGKIPKSMIIGGIAVISISFLSVSLYKFSWAVRVSENPIKDIIIEMFSMFQDYFSGPRVVANSIEMNNTYGKAIGLPTFVNDFIGSIPIISGFVNQADRINIYYNIYNNVFNKTLIISMLGIGYSYFPIFPPLFTVICQWLLIKVDYNFETCISIEYKYLYLYLGLYLSMCLGFNTQIIFAKFLIPFLPLFILFKVNNRICLRREVRLNRK